MWFSRQRCEFKSGLETKNWPANGGWNLIIKRRLAYRNYVTARRFQERRSVFSLEPRLEFVRVNIALSREPHTLSPLCKGAMVQKTDEGTGGLLELLSQLKIG